MGYFFHSTVAVITSDNFVIAGTAITMGANNLRFGLIKTSTSTGSIVPDKIQITTLSAQYVQGIANEIVIDA